MADFLFGDAGASQKPVEYSGIQVPTSQYDLPVSWLRGQRRITTNLLDYVDFQKHKQSAKGKGGGKGGGLYTYSAAVILSLGFGVIPDILNVWTQGSTTSTSTLADLGFTLMTGTALQSPWSFMVTNYPSHAQSYANIANLVNPKLDLGNSASVPDMGFEARQIPYTDYLETPGWTNPTTSANTPGRDVNMADFAPDFLMDPLVGGGFTSSDIPDLTQFRAYQAAQGLFFSPYLHDQQKGVDILNRWAKLANTWIYWSGTSFQFVPLGDTALTANGYTYTPDLTIDYVLGPGDFTSNPPVKVDIKDPADLPNRTIVSITDRTMGYVTNPIPYESLSLIRRYGARDADNVQADDIACPAVGNIVAQLIGRRNAHLSKTYSFKTSFRFCRALPGSIFSLTDPTQDLVNELVRITEVEEDENGEFTWSAEELPVNIGTYHARDVQAGPSPTTPDQQIDPGSVNTPAVAEPAQAGIVDTSTVLIAASGGANWGGANVWISFDDWASQSLIGKIQSPAIQGTLTANLASFGGPNPDTTNTLSVDATISRGEPEPVSNADADGLRTLSLVSAPPTTSGSDQVLDNSGELLAFGDTATTGTYTADLTYLQRGQLGTAAGAHSTDDLFTLFDLTGFSGSTVKFSLPAQYVGQPIWLKFASFNLFGKATQDLSVCQSYKFTPAGSGFGSGSGGVPAAPTGLAAVAGAQQAGLSWNANALTDNVTAYEIYRAPGTGASFGSASLIATVAGRAYTDTGLSVSTGYTYFLKAENALGLSAATAGVGVTTTSTSLGYSDEQAQDAVGAMVDTTIEYVDATPLLRRAALIGDVVAAAGSNTTTIKNDVALGGNPTTTTQAPGNNSTRIATTAYADAGDAATLSAAQTYADGKLAGLSWKQEVRAATTANGTLSTAFANGQIIDGVTLATGDRILLKNQSTASQNGLYVVAASGAPTRSTDADSGAELLDAACFVSEGTANADTMWVCTTNAPITPGSTSLAFVQFGAGGVSSVFGQTGAVSDLSGDVTTSGSSVATIPNNTVTYAKMQDVSATSRILGRKTAGAGDTEELTASEVLKFISSTQGDILYYNGTNWVALAAGTLGNLLQTQGAGANPTWAAPPSFGASTVLISEQTPTGASLTFSSIPATYRDLKLVVRGRTDKIAVSSDINIQINGDTGANYDFEELDYFGTGTQVFESRATTVLPIGTIAGDTAPAGVADAGEITIYDYRGTTFQKAAATFNGVKSGTASGFIRGKYGRGWWRNTAAITSIKLQTADASNFKAGTVVSLYGLY